jgi:hypothetical protein
VACLPDRESAAKTVPLESSTSRWPSYHARKAARCLGDGLSIKR